MDPALTPYTLYITCIKHTMIIFYFKSRYNLSLPLFKLNYKFNHSDMINFFMKL